MSRQLVVTLHAFAALVCVSAATATTAKPKSATSTDSVNACRLKPSESKLLDQLNSTFWQNYRLVGRGVSKTNVQMKEHKLPQALTDNCPVQMQPTVNAAVIKPFAQGPCAWEYTCNFNIDRYPVQLQMVRCKRDKFYDQNTGQPFYLDKACNDPYESPEGGIASGDCKELFMYVPMLFRAQCTVDVTKDLWVWENQQISIGCYCDPNSYYGQSTSFNKK